VKVCYSVYISLYSFFSINENFIIILNMVTMFWFLTFFFFIDICLGSPWLPWMIPNPMPLTLPLHPPNQQSICLTQKTLIQIILHSMYPSICLNYQNPCLCKICSQYYPIHNFCSYTKLQPLYKIFINQISFTYEPQFFTKLYLLWDRDRLGMK